MRTLTTTALLLLPLLVLATGLLAAFAWWQGDIQTVPAWLLFVSIALLLPTTGLAAAHLLTVRRRIRRIVEAMRRLQAGELGVRVPGGAGGGLGDLEAGFNAMVTELRASHDSLQDSIDQATRELQESMEVIEIRNAEVDQARRRAVEYSRLKSELLANMSHEIRTPLNGIGGFAGLLAKTRLDPGQRDYLHVIQDSTDALVRVVDDVLDFSRLESGGITLAHEPFSLRDCVERALAFRRADAHARLLELVCMVYNDVPDRLIGDPARITQILSKLLENAIRYTDRGEVVVRVMLDGESSACSEITLAVSDTGAPLPVSDQQRLFLALDRQSLTPTRLFGGAGLGLSIAAELASAMGGRIETDPGEKGGKLFRAVLMLERDPEGTMPPLTRPLHRRCLLLEPHTLSRRVLRNGLEEIGVAVDAEDRLHDPGSLDLGRYAMVALGCAGDDTSISVAVDWIGRVQRLREIPVMVLLSSSDPEVLARFVGQGVAACLSKPARRDHLLDGIKRCLGMQPSLACVHAQQVEAVAAYPLRGRTILAADDHPVNLRLIGHLLEGMGATVLTAEDGGTAVATARERQIDCAILDVHMPRMNGLEAARQLRALDPARPIPVIALTADAADRNLHDIRRSGIASILTKPVDEAVLRRTLVSLLNGNGKALVETRQSPPRGGEAEAVELPVRDPAQALRVAGGSKSIADKLFDDLCGDLADDVHEMGRSHAGRNWDELWQQAHRLLGAARVCGTPALLRALEQLQPAASIGDEAAIGPALQRVSTEMERLLASRDGV